MSQSFTLVTLVIGICFSIPGSYLQAENATTLELFENLTSTATAEDTTVHNQTNFSTANATWTLAFTSGPTTNHSFSEYSELSYNATFYDGLSSSATTPSFFDINMTSSATTLSFLDNNMTELTTAINSTASIFTSNFTTVSHTVGNATQVITVTSPETTQHTVTTSIPLNTSSAYDSYWVITVIDVKNISIITSPAFTLLMESRLAAVYNQALVSSSVGLQTSVGSRRRKRYVTNGNATVQMTNVTNPTSTNVDLIYFLVQYLDYTGNTTQYTSAESTCALMNSVPVQDVALTLGYVVITQCEAYIVVPPSPNYLWVIGAVIGGLVGLVLLIWLVMFCYFKFTRPPMSFAGQKRGRIANTGATVPTSEPTSARPDASNAQAESDQGFTGVVIANESNYEETNENYVHSSQEDVTSESRAAIVPQQRRRRKKRKNRKKTTQEQRRETENDDEIDVSVVAVATSMSDLDKATLPHDRLRSEQMTPDTFAVSSDVLADAVLTNSDTAAAATTAVSREDVIVPDEQSQGDLIAPAIDTTARHTPLRISGMPYHVTQSALKAWDPYEAADLSAAIFQDFNQPKGFVVAGPESTDSGAELSLNDFDCSSPVDDRLPQPAFPSPNVHSEVPTGSGVHVNRTATQRTRSDSQPVVHFASDRLPSAPSSRQAWSRDSNAVPSSLYANSQQTVPISEIIKQEYRLLYAPTVVDE